jgi:endoglycosylceramidase
VAWAKDHGIYVFLDMHQDLYSVLYSDGAPEWATLTDGKEHIHSGGVWSDAYFESPAVQAALDNFWDNKEGPGGVGIQDRFAQMWQHVAKRYVDEPHVLGYDLFNEPNAGSLNPQGQLLMVLGFGEALKEVDGESAPTAEELVNQWLDPAGRAAAMERLSDMRLYKPVLAAAESLFQEFERTKVVPMFQRVTDAIREVDPNHAVLLETSMSANMGVYTGIEPVMGPDGKRDPQQAYAPHGYDIVVDTPDLAAGSTDRVQLIFDRHAESAQRLNMPTIIGEWGAFGGAGEAIVPNARFVVEQFEKHLFSNTYWEYGKYVLDAPYLHVLNRGVPQRIAGTLVAYKNDFETNAFTCTWKEDSAVTAPTRIYLPERCFPGKDAVELEPAGSGFEVEPAVEGSKNVVLVIAPLGEEVERTLSVAPASS